MGRTRRPGTWITWAQGVGVLPLAWIPVSGVAGKRPSPARPARLGARLGGLRIDCRVRNRGVRLHRPGQRRPSGLLSSGHGAEPVRDGHAGVSIHLPVRSQPPVPRRKAHGRASGRRHATRSGRRGALRWPGPAGSRLVRPGGPAGRCRPGSHGDPSKVGTCTRGRVRRPGRCGRHHHGSTDHGQRRGGRPWRAV